MKGKGLDPKAFGKSLAVVSALFMLALSIAARSGVYTSAAEQMIKWHMFYSLTATGIVTGIIEAAVFGYVFGWLIVYFYNKYQ
tara:strand:+ start:4979 stop:5227 length:249 start_codon:yes stop_codon:yes gene_type:complete